MSNEFTIFILRSLPLALAATLDTLLQFIAHSLRAAAERIERDRQFAGQPHTISYFVALFFAVIVQDQPLACTRQFTQTVLETLPPGVLAFGFRINADYRSQFIKADPFAVWMF